MSTLILCLFIILQTTTSFAASALDWNKVAGVTAKEISERDTIKQQADILLLRAKYDELEKIASKYRTSKEEFSDGEWKLNVFYDELSFYLAFTLEEHWISHLEKLKQWVKEKPKSVTAHVALAECLVGYAFFGRSSKLAKDVSEDQWKIFYKRLTEATDVLNEVKDISVGYPEWAAAFQRLALGGLDRNDYNALFEKAIALEPTFNMYYFRKALHLLPRWYGEPGEWEQFARQTADEINGPAGDVLYARIVWFLDVRVPATSLAFKPTIDWDRVRSGLDAIHSNNIKGADVRSHN